MATRRGKEGRALPRVVRDGGLEVFEIVGGTAVRFRQAIDRLPDDLSVDDEEQTVADAVLFFLRDVNIEKDCELVARDEYLFCSTDTFGVVDVASVRVAVGRWFACEYVNRNCFIRESFHERLHGDTEVDEILERGDDHDSVTRSELARMFSILDRSGVPECCLGREVDELVARARSIDAERILTLIGEGRESGRHVRDLMTVVSERASSGSRKHEAECTLLLAMGQDRFKLACWNYIGYVVYFGLIWHIS